MITVSSIYKLKKSAFVIIHGVLLFLTGCTDKKEDFTAAKGKYFVETLGTNVRMNEKTLSSRASAEQLDHNYEYHYGNIPFVWLQDMRPSYEVIGTSRCSAVSIPSTPIFTQDGMLTLNDKGDISLLKLQDGKKNIIWKSNFFKATAGKEKNAFRFKNLITSDSNVCTNLAVAESNGVVITTCGIDVVKAFSLKDGSFLWEQVVDLPVDSAPLVIPQTWVVVVQSASSALYGLNLNDGKIAWLIPGVSVNTSSSIAPNKFMILTSGQVDSVLRHTKYGTIQLINAKNGEILWEITLPAPQRYVKGAELTTEYNEIAFDEKNKYIYMQSGDGIVAAIKIGDSKPTWIKPLMVTKPLWIDEKHIYAVSNVGSVIAMCKQSGEIVWLNNVIEKINERNSNGSMGFTRREYDHITLSAPVLIGDNVVVVSSNGKLILLNHITGKITDIMQINRGIFNRPIIHENMLYMFAKNGTKLIKLAEVNKKINSEDVL